MSVDFGGDKRTAVDAELASAQATLRAAEASVQNASQRDDYANRVYDECMQLQRRAQAYSASISMGGYSHAPALSQTVIEMQNKAREYTNLRQQGYGDRGDIPSQIAHAQWQPQDPNGFQQTQQATHFPFQPPAAAPPPFPAPWQQPAPLPPFPALSPLPPVSQAGFWQSPLAQPLGVPPPAPLWNGVLNAFLATPAPVPAAQGPAPAAAPHATSGRGGRGAASAAVRVPGGRGGGRGRGPSLASAPAIPNRLTDKQIKAIIAESETHQGGNGTKWTDVKNALENLVIDGTAWPAEFWTRPHLGDRMRKAIKRYTQSQGGQQAAAAAAAAAPPGQESPPAAPAAPAAAGQEAAEVSHRASIPLLFDPDANWKSASEALALGEGGILTEKDVKEGLTVGRVEEALRNTLNAKDWDLDNFVRNNSNWEAYAAPLRLAIKNALPISPLLSTFGAGQGAQLDVSTLVNYIEEFGNEQLANDDDWYDLLKILNQTPNQTPATRLNALVSHLDSINLLRMPAEGLGASTPVLMYAKAIGGSNFESFLAKKLAPAPVPYAPEPAAAHAPVPNPVPAPAPTPEAPEEVDRTPERLRLKNFLDLLDPQLPLALRQEPPPFAEDVQLTTESQQLMAAVGGVYLVINLPNFYFYDRVTHAHQAEVDAYYEKTYAKHLNELNPTVPFWGEVKHVRRTETGLAWSVQLSDLLSDLYQLPNVDEDRRRFVFDLSETAVRATLEAERNLSPHSPGFHERYLAWLELCAHSPEFILVSIDATKNTMMDWKNGGDVLIGSEFLPLKDQHVPDALRQERACFGYTREDEWRSARFQRRYLTLAERKRTQQLRDTFQVEVKNTLDTYDDLCDTWGADLKAMLRVPSADGSQLYVQSLINAKLDRPDATDFPSAAPWTGIFTGFVTKPLDATEVAAIKSSFPQHRAQTTSALLDACVKLYGDVQDLDDDIKAALVFVDPALASAPPVFETVTDIRGRQRQRQLHVNKTSLRKQKQEKLAQFTVAHLALQEACIDQMVAASKPSVSKLIPPLGGEPMTVDETFVDEEREERLAALRGDAAAEQLFNDMWDNGDQLGYLADKFTGDSKIPAAVLLALSSETLIELEEDGSDIPARAKRAFLEAGLDFPNLGAGASEGGGEGEEEVEEEEVEEEDEEDVETEPTPEAKLAYLVNLYGADNKVDTETGENAQAFFTRFSALAPAEQAAYVTRHYGDDTPLDQMPALITLALTEEALANLPDNVVRYVIEDYGRANLRYPYAVYDEDEGGDEADAALVEHGAAKRQRFAAARFGPPSEDGDDEGRQWLDAQAWEAYIDGQVPSDYWKTVLNWLLEEKGRRMYANSDDAPAEGFKDLHYRCCLFFSYGASSGIVYLFQECIKDIPAALPLLSKDVANFTNADVTVLEDCMPEFLNKTKLMITNLATNEEELRQPNNKLYIDATTNHRVAPVPVRGETMVEGFWDRDKTLRLNAYQERTTRIVVGQATNGTGVLVADEMGLGKTVTAIASVYAFTKQRVKDREAVIPRDLRVLVICPKTVGITWAREISDWTNYKETLNNVFAVTDQVGPYLTALKAPAHGEANLLRNWYIINYEKFARKDKLNQSIKLLEAIASFPWDFIILDEVHYRGVMSAKPNGKPANTATQGGLRHIFERVARSQRPCGYLAMTGTPIKKNVAHDMAALCSFFPFPSLPKDPTFWTFDSSSPTGWIKKLPELLDKSNPEHRNYNPKIFPYIIRNSKQTLSEAGRRGDPSADDDQKADKDGNFPDFGYDANNPVHKRKKVGPLYSYVYTYTISESEEARVQELTRRGKYTYLQRSTDCTTLSIMPAEATQLTGVDRVELTVTGTVNKKKTAQKVNFHVDAETLARIADPNTAAEIEKGDDANEDLRRDADAEYIDAGTTAPTAAPSPAENGDGEDDDDDDNVPLSPAAIPKEKLLDAFKKIRLQKTLQDISAGTLNPTKFRRAADVVKALLNNSAVFNQEVPFEDDTGKCSFAQRASRNVDDYLPADSATTGIVVDVVKLRQHRRVPGGAGTRKVLVFGIFTEPLKAFARYLKAHGYLSYEPDVLCGETSKNRVTTNGREGIQSIIDFTEARGDKRRDVLLVQLTTGGAGLNLQAASAVVFLDLWYNASDMNQAVARSWRLKQARDVKVVYMRPVCSGNRPTVESIIFDDFVEPQNDSNEAAYKVFEGLAEVREPGFRVPPPRDDDDKARSILDKMREHFP
jgi:hypothetical protein